MIQKIKNMFKFLLLLLSLPVLLVALTVIIGAVMLSKAIDNKKTQETGKGIENDDLACCLITDKE